MAEVRFQNFKLGISRLTPSQALSYFKNHQVSGSVHEKVVLLFPLFAYFYGHAEAEENLM